MEETTRAQYLQWCKDRAMEYIKMGDARQAVTSMLSDLGKHPETENHPAIQMGMMLMMIGTLSSVEEAKEFILGFN